MSQAAMSAISTGTFSKDVVVAEVVCPILDQSLDSWHVGPCYSRYHHDTSELELPVALDEWFEESLDGWVHVGLSDCYLLV